MDDLEEMGVKAVTYSGGGEPLVYPYIEEAMRRTLDKGIHLSAITNGQRLSGGRAELLGEAEWVRISVDYYDPKGFSRYRGRSERMFREVIDNTRDFAR